MQRTRCPSVWLGALAVAVLCFAGPAWAATPGVAQLAGQQGCITSTADVAGCAAGHGLANAVGVAVSPDGANVYVAGAAVSAFSRAADTGALTQIGCVSQDGGDGTERGDGRCVDGHALAGPSSLAVSPDGRHVYVASAGSHGVAVLARDASTGALTPVSCVMRFNEHTVCSGAAGLVGASAVAVSPDGTRVYVAASRSDGVAAFARDASTGSLTPLGCVTDDGSDGGCADGAALEGTVALAVAPGGGEVYAASLESDALSILREGGPGPFAQAACIREGGGPPCGAGVFLDAAAGVASSPDGRHVYVASAASGGLSIFSRDDSTGGLTGSGCVQGVEVEEEEFEEEEEEVEEAQDQPACAAEGRGLAGARGVAVSPDGRRVYTVSGFSWTLTEFARDPQTGLLAERGCITQSDDVEIDEQGCSEASGLEGAAGVAVSPDSRNVYVAAAGGTLSVYGAAVSVAVRSGRLDRRARARVALTCPASRTEGCSGRVLLARLNDSRALSAHRPGARRFRVGPGRTSVMRVRVPRSLRRLAARRRGIRAMAVAFDRGAATRPAVGATRLRARR